MRVHFIGALSLFFLVIGLSNNGLAQPLSGNYVIGSGGNYTTITAAVNDLKSKGVNGPVIFNIKAGQYMEQVSIPAITGASASNTITFQSQTMQAADVLVVHAGSGTPYKHHVIQLDGADFIVIRHISVTNLSVTFGSGIQLRRGADYNLIEHCIVTVDTVPETNIQYIINDGPVQSLATNSIVGIVFSDNPDSGPEVPQVPVLYSSLTGSYNVVRNNKVMGGSYGIGLSGQFSNRSFKNQILNNTILGPFGECLYADYQDSLRVEGNRIKGPSVNTRTSTCMYFRYCTNSQWINNYTWNAGYYGVQLSLCGGLFANNQLAGGFKVYGQGGTGIGYGLYINGSYAIDILHNSVNYDAVVPNADTYAFYVINMANNTRIMNNVFCNSGGGLSTHIRYTGTKTFEADYNVLFTPGAKFAQFQAGIYANLSLYQAAIGQEKNSLSLNPGFVHAFDLHITNTALSSKGTGMPEVPKDMDGERRNPRLPEPGADELLVENKDLMVSAMSLSSFKMGSTPLNWELTNGGISGINATKIYLAHSMDSGLTWSIPDTVLVNLPATYDALKGTFKEPLHFSGTKIYPVCVKIMPPGLPGDQLPSNDVMCRKYCVPIGDTSFIIGHSTSAQFPGLDSALKFLSTLPCGIGGNVDLVFEKGQYPGGQTITALPGIGGNNFLTLRSASGSAADTRLIRQTKTFKTNHAVLRIQSPNVRIMNMGFVNLQDTVASGIHLADGVQNTTLEGCHIELRSDTSLQNFGVLLSSKNDPMNAIAAGNIQINGINVQNATKGVLIRNSGSGVTRIMGSQIINARERGIEIIGATDSVWANTVDMGGQRTLNQGITVSGSVRPVVVQGNKVTGPMYGGILLEACGAVGASSYTPAVNQVYNNEVATLGSEGNTGFGIFFNGCGRIDVAHNSIRNQFADDYGISLGVIQSGRVNGYNNIVVQEGKGLALELENKDSIQGWNHNIYFTQGPNLGRVSGTTASGLNQLKTQTGGDQNSLVHQVLFNGPYDLQTSDIAINNKGINLNWVPVDRMGVPRHPSQPDPGAYEFSIASDTLDLAAIAWKKPALDTIILGAQTPVSIEVKNTGTIGTNNFKIHWEQGSFTKSETYTQGLIVGQSKEFELTGGTTWNAQGKVLWCATLDMSGDQVNTNNKICKEFYVKDTTTGLLMQQRSGMLLYPNPGNTVLFIDLPKGANPGDFSPVYIHNSLGRLVYSSPWDPKGIVLEALAPGTYLIRAGNSLPEIWIKQ